MKKLAIIFVFFIVNVGYAQVANDEYKDAIELFPSSNCPADLGTLQDATTSSLSTLCAGNYNDVFYKFTAIETYATINVTVASGLDVVVSLFTFNVSPVSLYCVNNSGVGGTETINARGLYAGTIYYIQVQSYSSTLPAVSVFNICVVTPVLPINDDCVNAINLTPSMACMPVSGSLQDASTSQLVSSCFGNSDVFYKFSAIASTARISVTGSSGLDVVVAVYSACDESAIVCQDIAYVGEMEIVNLLDLTVGSVYYIQVQAYDSPLPSTGTFSICVQSADEVIPSNDNCANAITLNPSPSCNSTWGTLLNATSSSIPNSCSGNTDVFYSFEATVATAVIDVAPSVGMDIAVGVFESCSGVQVSCTNAQRVGGIETVSLSRLVIGNSYIIQVQNVSATSPANAVFAICVKSASLPAPVNDECANALTIYPTTAYTPITGTVKEATTSTVTNSCTGNSDVFYKFTAGARTATITVVGSTGFDPVVGLFRTCGTSHIDCVDLNYNVGGTEVLTPTNLIVGETYYLKVQGYSNSLPTTFTFTVAVQSTPFATGIDASTFVQQINVFPNPTQNVLYVENILMETVIQLVDLRGRVLFTKNSSSDTQIDLSEFEAGVYILKLSVDELVENRRVVLSK